MASSEQEGEFLARLRAAFAVEADEHLQAMSAGLLELEKTPAGSLPAPLIEIVFREAHSLKGAARAVNASEVETLCQAMETIFAACKKGEMSLSPVLFDTLYHCIDTIEKLLAASNEQAVPASQIAALVQQLTRASTGQSPASQTEPRETANGRHANGSQPANEIVSSPIPPQNGAPLSPSLDSAPQEVPPSETPVPIAPPQVQEVQSQANGGARTEPVPAAEKSSGSRAPAETVRISTSKLDALLLQVEEMLAVKLTSGQRAADLREVEDVLELWRKEWSKVQPTVSDLEKLKNGSASASASVPGQTPASLQRLLEFLDWNGNYIKALEGKLVSLSRAAEHDRRTMSGMVDALLEDTKKLLMMPFSTLLGVFPKMVRDLARDQNKDVQLVLRGGDVEIDKRILEEMKDPLIHLLRNCVDHGIEAADERAARGKTPRATLTVAVSQVGGNEVELLIADDGGGIDVEGVKAAAVRHGTLSEEDAGRLDEAQAIALIFQSEVSTSRIITEISGRGLGMAIVREKIEKLGGRIQVETAAGLGTSFRILLPLTLATFRGVLVEAAGRQFIIPIADVERVVRAKADEIQTVENRQTAALNRGSSERGLLSLVRLADVLELPQTQTRETQAETSGCVLLVVLGSGEKAVAFEVDAVLNEQEVLVKKLGKPLARVRNVAGATVLGSGKAVPILNAGDLLKSAARVAQGAPHVSSADAEADEEEGAKLTSVLIAEDSITSRMLLKNILESAGYQVSTAVDGMDALTALRGGDFDLVVSDIDMPRLNGLDLTARIRADERLAQMPVVLVTARGTSEDRERGIEVGANAYLVKSSFDQSNLLDAIRRLV